MGRANIDVRIQQGAGMKLRDGEGAGLVISGSRYFEGDDQRVRIQFLGPLQALVGDEPVRLGGARRQRLLLALLLERGRVVPLPRLIDAVWGEHPPDSARTQIAIVVSGLRRAFEGAGAGPAVFETARPGYRIREDGVRIDAFAAEDLVTRARATAATGCLDEASSLLRAALELWRGPVLAGLDSPIFAGAVRQWEELRLTAAEELAEIELVRGRHSEHVGELIGLVAAQPFRERPRAQLMTALVRAGRRVEALRVYQEARKLLDAELGLQPGRELRELHSAILRDDPAMQWRQTRAGCAAGPR